MSTILQINGSKSSDVNYPADQWLQVFTESQGNVGAANVGAGVYSELFSFYATGGHNRTAFEGEKDAIKIALGQLFCPGTKFNKAIILSDSQSAINSIGNREPPKTTEIYECKKLYELLREKNKTVVLQWIPGHCGIKGNELADALAKKGITILHCMYRPMSFHTMKTLIRREFKTSRCNELEARTKEKQWTVALSDITDWPRIEAVAEFRLRTGHDCLAKHLYSIGIYAQPTCPLCDLQEGMEKTRLFRCPVLKIMTETQIYLKARRQLTNYC
ncbi:unnamed protein product [Rodentolepis nana]|uniref:RNase H type-1 domain-containing protein n=1 Tax=Rodentolepis nana TaxID=102285 RepID=A0A0R3T5P1_RODNA|nr:unnamed protein product [Rodentolepis nana]